MSPDLMAKKDQKIGVTREDMEAYQELNKQLKDPFRDNLVRTDPGHPSGTNPVTQNPHGHVGPVHHIPIINP